MKHSERATHLIEQFEGVRNDAYADPATGGAPWTIGVGHTGPEVHKGLHWTDDQVAAALDADLARFDDGVTALIGNAPTTQNQFDACVSLSFNIGLGAFAKSTLLSRHKVGDYLGASKEFLKWNRAGGRVLNGLTRRRHAEAALYGATA